MVRPVELGDRHLVLMGLMGVGKSTVGQIVARRLQRALIDSDQRIELITGSTVRQILAAEGVESLRRHEAAALFDALDDVDPRVIAAAAGVVLDPDHCRSLRAASDAGRACIVWLDGDPALLAPRTRSSAHRPWLDADPVGTLTRMRAERADLYRAVADEIVTVDHLTPDEVADEVLT